MCTLNERQAGREGKKMGEKVLEETRCLAAMWELAAVRTMDRSEAVFWNP